MEVLEQKIDKIKTINNDLNNFIQTDTKINKLYQKFRAEFTTERSIYEFLFEKTFDNDKKLVDLYLEKNSNLPKEERAEFMGLRNSINSIFEVINLDKEGFTLYNLVNEKVYRVKSLIKMVKYRQIFKGSYLVGRIFLLDGDYHIYNIEKTFKSSERLAANKIAVQKQMDNPKLIYEDNNKKFKEVQKSVNILSKKFDNFFGNRDIVSNNIKINGLLDVFNDYVDNPKLEVCFDEFIETPEKYVYFDITKKKNASNIYDVCLLFDPDNGLQTVPFFATFSKIFELEDHKSIEGYKDCVKYFFKTDTVSPYILKMVYDRFSDNFLQRTKEILNIKKDINFEELISQYKQKFLDEQIFSTPTILYSSQAFEEFMDLSAQKPVKKSMSSVKAKRNEPCPCGSGKKYKKCCL